jgi:hypothetical protein
MDHFLLLTACAIFIVLACLLIFYLQTQQSFNEIRNEIHEIQQQQVSRLPSETLKRDMAMHHDKLVLLEAEISKYNRESLTEEELKTFFVSRNQIQKHIASLKANGSWVGLPFEFEWSELSERMPNLVRLYKKSEADKAAALEAEQAQNQPADPKLGNS